MQKSAPWSIPAATRCIEELAWLLQRHADCGRGQVGVACWFVHQLNFHVVTNETLIREGPSRIKKTLNRTYLLHHLVECFLACIKIFRGVAPARVKNTLKGRDLNKEHVVVVIITSDGVRSPIDTFKPTFLHMSFIAQVLKKGPKRSAYSRPDGLTYSQCYPGSCRMYVQRRASVWCHTLG